MTHPLRLLVFDRTCGGRYGLPGLSQAWRAGRLLYEGLGRIDGSRGVASWAEALDWLASHGAPAPIAEIQLWGHGRFGQVLVAGEVLDTLALAPGHPHHDRLAAIRARMLPGAEGLWWFRTCETFGAAAGHRFARAWTDFFGCRAAGHTHVIGVWQSGLHALSPGQQPHWPEDEGVTSGGGKGKASSPRAPNTISCFHGRVPGGF